VRTSILYATVIIALVFLNSHPAVPRASNVTNGGRAGVRGDGDGIVPVPVVDVRITAIGEDHVVRSNLRTNPPRYICAGIGETTRTFR